VRASQGDLDADSSSSPRHALRVLLKVNDTLEHILAERMRAQHVTKCGHTIENGQLEADEHWDPQTKP
jgi:hypothetical protein